MSVEPRAEEIARIERELEILRSRYALMEYWGGVLRVFFKLLLPFLAIVAIVIAYFVMTLVDIVFGLFTLGFFAIIGFLGWRVLSWNSYSIRWIDLASPQMAPMGFFGPGRFFSSNPRSEAQVIEELIRSS